MGLNLCRNLQEILMHACFGFTNNTCTYKFMEETTLISNDPYISKSLWQVWWQRKSRFMTRSNYDINWYWKRFQNILFQNSFHPWKHQCMGYIVSISSFKALVGFQNINLPPCIYLRTKLFQKNVISIRVYRFSKASTCKV